MKLIKNETWEPEEGDIIQWQRAYQAVNVRKELLAMESWLDANPTRRKTKTGIKRFVNSWLARAQNQGGSSPMAKSIKSNSIRARTIDESLTDITWLDPEDQVAMKEYYLTTRGYYFDGAMQYE